MPQLWQGFKTILGRDDHTFVLKKNNHCSWIKYHHWKTSKYQFSGTIEDKWWDHFQTCTMIWNRKDSSSSIANCTFSITTALYFLRKNMNAILISLVICYVHFHSLSVVDCWSNSFLNIGLSPCMHNSKDRWRANGNIMPLFTSFSFKVIVLPAAQKEENVPCEGLFMGRWRFSYFGFKFNPQHSLLPEFNHTPVSYTHLTLPTMPDV